MTLDFDQYLQKDRRNGSPPVRCDVLQNMVFENCWRNRATRRSPPADMPVDQLRQVCSGSSHQESSLCTPKQKREKEMFNTSVKASFRGFEVVSVEVTQSRSASCLDRPTSAQVMPRKRSVSFADENGHDLATYCLIPTNESCRDCGGRDFEELNYEVPSFFETAFAVPYSPRPVSSPVSSPPLSPGDDDGDYFSPIHWEPRTERPEKQVELENNVVCSLCFKQPASKFDEFLKAVEEKFVCLENVRVADITVFFSVKVKNIGFEKSVFARCSYDSWLSHVDIPASYVPSGCDTSVHDTFSFTVCSPPPTTLSRKGPRTAELAVCYSVNNAEYWDNNEGKNYRIVWSCT